MMGFQNGFWLMNLLLGSKVLLHAVTDACSMAPIDIRDHGVWIDKIDGSRVEYKPFPRNFFIAPGQTIKIEFNTTSPDGLVFLLGSFDTGDMIMLSLSEGYLTLVRHCSPGHTYERYPKKLDDGNWHKLMYIHSRTGGEVEIDDVNPFRQYHIGPCSDFNSVIFGGLPPDLDIDSWPGEATLYRFQGCLRKMRIDGKIPLLHPKYTAVSGCHYSHLH